MNVFRLNNVGVIEIAYPEITIYKEFHNIVTTYPSNYDLYFKYIYLISDYKSKCNQEGFTEKESIKYATSLLGLTKEQVNNDLINKLEFDICKVLMVYNKFCNITIDFLLREDQCGRTTWRRPTAFLHSLK
jgi:hypothetical protein